MIMVRKLRIAAACGALALALAPAVALAAPSGGGGGSVPSSGPGVDPAASYAEGLEALKAGDYKKAEKKFGEVLSVAPKNPEANYYMGLAKAKGGKDKQALKYFERAIKERETFIEAREQHALASIRLGDIAKARSQRDAVAAIAADCTPQTCDAPFVERCGKAVANIDAAIGAATATMPEEPDASDGQEQSAAPAPAEFAYLFLEAPGSGAGLYRDAVRAVNEARYEAAIATLTRAQSAIGPHPDVLNYLGFANRKLGRLDAAKAYYGEALALAPDHLGANEYLGELHLELGEIEAARQRLARLDRACAFGCAEREDLARLIDIAAATRRASR